MSEIEPIDVVVQYLDELAANGTMSPKQREMWLGRNSNFAFTVNFVVKFGQFKIMALGTMVKVWINHDPGLFEPMQLVKHNRWDLSEPKCLEKMWDWIKEGK